MTVDRSDGDSTISQDEQKAPRSRGFCFPMLAPIYFPLVVELPFVAPECDMLLLGLFVPDDFMFAPVVVDDFVEVDVWCLVCLYIVADAAKGEPARPAITSAAIVSLLFIMKWNSLLHHTGGNLLPAGTVPEVMSIQSDIAMNVRRVPNPLLNRQKRSFASAGIAVERPRHPRGQRTPGPPIPHGVLPT